MQIFLTITSILIVENLNHKRKTTVRNTYTSLRSNSPTLSLYQELILLSISTPRAIAPPRTPTLQASNPCCGVTIPIRARIEL